MDKMIKNDDDDNNNNNNNNNETLYSFHQVSHRLKNLRTCLHFIQF